MSVYYRPRRIALDTVIQNFEVIKHQIDVIVSRLFGLVILHFKFGA